ncbi:3-deoxy-D-manno-octulosonic acid transferase [Salegentibacter sp. HM20]
MRKLYTILIKLLQFLLPLGRFFGKKPALFVEGRKHLFKNLEQQIEEDSNYIWVHTASLGEFEQAVPVIEQLRQEFPHYKILVSFFSPSGYENKKTHRLVDVITYIPLDTPTNASKFLDLVQPILAIFVKYEVWPNFLAELKNRKIHSILISALFRKDQIYFKPSGKWMREALAGFNHIFVQNQASENLLNSFGFVNVSVSGDTRFDRVHRQLAYDNRLEFMEAFLDNKLCFVAGSTWPEDEELLQDFLGELPPNLKVVIAPHEIKQEKLQQLEAKLPQKNIRHSQIKGKALSEYQILIIDNIGMLGRLYSYADFAYVGGAAGKTGLHNILEPAVFGIPVLSGMNTEKFPEAGLLEQEGGLFRLENPEHAKNKLTALATDERLRKQAGTKSANFIQEHIGATAKIIGYLKTQFS